MSVATASRVELWADDIFPDMVRADEPGVVRLKLTPSGERKIREAAGEVGKKNVMVQVMFKAEIFSDPIYQWKV